MSGLSERNPYVGPRPIQQGEPLYGRKDEIRELFNVLQARRIILLHSPSGAGKSSLVQAGLIPRLTAAKFDVWKTIRVNLDPQDLADIPPGTNRYLLSAMISLEEELPAERRRDPSQLANLNFASYVRGRPRRRAQADASVVLIFDQFEELLTAAPLAIEEKGAFFTAVGEALEAANLWALFIIREDYLGALAPYRDRVPTRLSNTFRLDLLGLDGAREAIEEPSVAAGRAFPAVVRLIRDLSLIQVQQTDGTFVAEQGLYVEPVQLQVVCRRLWEAMPPDHLAIDDEDVEKYADVSTALAGYYADAVERLSRGDVAVARAIREWIGSKLIVGGIRSQVRQEPGRTAGLDNDLLGPLLDSYLVRTEQRAGAHWFELSHDRLVEPVQLDNKAWEAKNLHPLQVQAKLWEDSHRPAALRLAAEALQSAQAWADANPTRLTEGEREFLAQSHEHRAREQAARRRLVALAATSIVVAVVVGVLGLVALAAWQKANAAEAVALTERDAAKAAREEAIKERQTAERLKERADADKQAAETSEQRAVSAQAEAETARLENEKMLQNTFRAALRGLIASLALKGSISGEVEVDAHWTPLIVHDTQCFIASRVLQNKGRIIVAGNDSVLSIADREGFSVFLEMTSKWLLSGQTHQDIIILSSKPENRLKQLQRNLDVLSYTEHHFTNPSLDKFATAGMLIIDNRQEAFTSAESSAIKAFLARGGGLLAVGVGWKLPARATYAMNSLLGEYGATWNHKKLEGLEKPPVDPEQCKSLRDKVDRAQNEDNFHDMLRLLLSAPSCWPAIELARLKTLAFKELGKFRECAKAGRGVADPEVVKWVRLCERRAESG